jgi:Tol biopolymer transport system component
MEAFMPAVPRRRAIALLLGGTAALGAAALARPAAAALNANGRDGAGGKGTPPSGAASAGPEQAEPSGTPHRPTLAVLTYVSRTDSTAYLLQRETGRYMKMPYANAAPSPDGTRVLLQSSTYPYAVGVRNLSGGAIRWVSGDFGGRGGHWSPDGRSILITSMPKDGVAGFAIVDSATLVPRFVPLPEVQGLTDVVWTPDGRHLALTLIRTTGLSFPEIKGIRFYDLDGRTTGTIQSAYSLVRTTDFSPNGKLIAITENPARTPVQNMEIIEADTGTVVHTFTVNAGVSFAGWYDDQHPILQAHAILPGGTANVPVLQVVDVTGVVERTIPLPSDTAPPDSISGIPNFDGILLGPADGIPTNADAILF